MVGLIVAAGILVVGILLPTLPSLSVAEQRALAVFLSTLVLWLTRPVPYVVSSLLSVALLFALGVVDSFDVAATGFTSTLVFFLLSLLLLGDAVTNVGLDRWLARRLLSAESTPSRTLQSVSGSVLALALVMPSAMARAVTFVPVVKRFAGTFEPDGDGEGGFERAAFLVLGHVNPIASMALMTGGGMALVTSEIVTTTVEPITWVDWAVLMVPPTMVLYAAAAVAAGHFAGIGSQTTVSAGDSTQLETADVGLPPSATGTETPPAADAEKASLTRDQRLVVLVLCGTIAGWVGGSFVGIPMVLPAVAAVTALSMPSVGVITTDDIAETSWGIIFLIGAMLSILDALQATGAIELVIGVLTRLIPFAALTDWQLVAVLVGLAVGIRTLFSTGSAAIVVTLPIILELAAAFEINRLFLALTVLLVVGSTTILPFNTTAVLVSMDQGPLSNRDIATFGLVTMALAVVVAALSWMVYWPLVS